MPSRLSNSRAAPTHHTIACGGGTVPILAYGDLDVNIANRRARKPNKLRLQNVALCVELPTSVVSLQVLESLGYDWNHRTGEIRIRGRDLVGYTERHYGQYLLELNAVAPRQLDSAYTAILSEKSQQESTVTAETAQPDKQPTWDYKPKPAHSKRKTTQPRSWGDALLWHRRMGHIGPAALAQLGNHTLGVKLRGPATVECQDCALAKITQRGSHVPDPHVPTRPFYRIDVDWFDLEEGWDGYQGDGQLVRRVLLIACAATGLILPYFATTAREAENLPYIKDSIMWLKLRYGLDVRVIRADGELNRNQTKAYLDSAGITSELCAPDTHEQNGRAERVGRLILTKARSMRLSGRLPHAL